MKKNRIHIALTVFLLALMLVGRVGIHIFHHHDSTAKAGMYITKSASEVLPLVAEHNSEADCKVCKLDTFQALFLEALIPFVFLVIVAKPIYTLLFSDLIHFSIFSKSRGPPFSLTVV